MIANFDIARGVFLVRRGNGAKHRNVMLSPQLPLTLSWPRRGSHDQSGSAVNAGCVIMVRADIHPNWSIAAFSRPQKQNA
jgi:hypothetical protein